MKGGKAQSVASEIFDLYTVNGGEAYAGEKITQLEHMAQAAQLAMNENYDDEVVLAAFLHDIGHICIHPDAENTMGAYGIMDHEEMGARFLEERGFSERLLTLVRSHVDAKRYLAYKYPEYREQLSDASRQTLMYQGGVMSPAEAVSFEEQPLFETILKMRRWDERAKIENLPLPDLGLIKKKMINYLNALQNE